MNFLSAGIPVTIVEMGQEALDRGAGLMRKNYEASAAKGRFTGEQVEKAMGLLNPTLDFNALADCDLIIEAVYENMDVKKEVFGRLDKIAKPGAILASNTSYLNIDEIAASISRPQDVVGMHFFSPANVMKLLEVVRGAKTAPDVLMTVMGLSKKIRKVAVVAGVCHGFIGNRMLMPRQVEATKLLLEGATPEQIDRVHVEFGMPMGPFQMADLAGVDIGWHRDPNRIENIRDALAAEGRWGQKKQAGFYDYDEKRRPSPSARVQEIIDEFRAKEGVEKREISDEEIVERTLYTMVNEGAKILEEGMAQRASDIDVVWVYGYGWPVYRGGPMAWADTVGLGKIVEGLKRQEAAHGRRLQLLEAAARQGGGRREVHALGENGRSNPAAVIAFPEGEEKAMTSVPETAPQDAVLRYSNATVAFHWITVALVLFQAYLGFRFGWSEPGPDAGRRVPLAQDRRRRDPAADARAAGLSPQEPTAAVPAGIAGMGAHTRGLESPAVLYTADRDADCRLHRRVRLCQRADHALAGRHRSAGHPRREPRDRRPGRRGARDFRVPAGGADIGARRRCAETSVRGSLARFGTDAAVHVPRRAGGYRAGSGRGSARRLSIASATPAAPAPARKVIAAPSRSQMKPAATLASRVPMPLTK